jgi:hypothetical protein
MQGVIQIINQNAVNFQIVLNSLLSAAFDTPLFQPQSTPPRLKGSEAAVTSRSTRLAGASGVAFKKVKSVTTMNACNGDLFWGIKFLHFRYSR